MSKLLDSDGLARYHQNISQVIVDGDSMRADVTVELGVNGTLGGYKTGDTIAEGTSIETVIKKLLAKQIPPTYTAPTVSIVNNGGSSAGSYEIGTTISPKMKATYTQNDGGDLTEIKILANVATGTASPLTGAVEPFV